MAEDAIQDITYRESPRNGIEAVIIADCRTYTSACAVTTIVATKSKTAQEVAKCRKK
jgi:hypothetical protein